MFFSVRGSLYIIEFLLPPICVPVCLFAHRMLNIIEFNYMLFVVLGYITMYIYVYISFWVLFSYMYIRAYLLFSERFVGLRIFFGSVLPLIYIFLYIFWDFVVFCFMRFLVVNIQIRYRISL